MTASTPNPASASGRAPAPAPASGGGRTPPGPPKKFGLNQLPAMRADVVRTLLELSREHGEVSLFHMGPLPIVFVTSADGVERVLQENGRHYSKQTPGFAAVREFLGDGLLTSEGDFWLRQRRLAQPAFHRQRLAGFAELMVKAAQDTAAEWASAKEVDVLDSMMRLALTVVSGSLFGQDLKADARKISDALEVALHEAQQRITGLKIPKVIPTPSNLRMRRSVEALDEVCHRLIAERRKDGTTRHDLLAMLMEAVDEDTGERMSDGQLRDEVMTLLLAGHETSANALTWLFALLSRHPEVRTRLEAEIAAVLGSRDPQVEDFPKLTYLRQVIDETLRLYPPAWAFSRRALEEDEVDGYRIPAGQIVFMSPFITHRNPKLWDNPEGFDPERFSPERAKGRPRFAYFPFGGGPRQCIGNMFALMEITFAVAVLLRRFRLDLLPGQVLQTDASITLRPKNGLRMRVQPR